MLDQLGGAQPDPRDLREITILTDQWKGVSSAGVTAAFQAEAAETTDTSPTLAQPVIDCAMGRAFIPFSIELGQDWAGILRRNSPGSSPMD